MSLRVIYKPDQVQKWIADRHGTPARRRGSDTELQVLFGDTNSDYEPITVDELIEAMKFHHLIILVDQEAGKTYHKIYQHG